MKTPENVPDNNVGRKTPEEIKKGLKICMVCQSCTEYGEPNCPYNDVPKCMEVLLDDAFAYIQQLEVGIDHAEKVARECARSITENLGKLESRLAHAERERDAAVAALENVIGLSAIVNLDCEYCKHMDRPTCEECDWEWRGVVPENTKEDA